MHKQFFCDYHKQWFKGNCQDCLQDIYNQMGFNNPFLPISIFDKTKLNADYSWDDTYEYIEAFKVKKGE